MGKRLIAPGITEGDWLFARKSDGAWNLYNSVDVPSGNAIICARNIWPHRVKESEANARFLAGSKKVAEAAADLLNLADDDELGALSLRPLRAALLSSGYEEEKS